MPSASRLLEFIATSLVIILVPGPGVMFTVARAIAWGRTTAVVTALGGALGMLTLSTLIAFGLGPALQRSAFLYQGVQWAGGAYLCWLGIDAIRHRELHAARMSDRESSAPSRWRVAVVPARADLRGDCGSFGQHLGHRRRNGEGVVGGRLRTAGSTSNNRRDRDDPARPSRAGDRKSPLTGNPTGPSVVHSTGSVNAAP